MKQKIQTLRDGLVTGDTARYNRTMMARAIRSLARFSEDYRAIDEIVLNSNTLEASSRISFASVKRGGIYHTHPAIIESLTQSCGYTMNCNDGNDLDVEVFMVHGWKSFQIFEPMNLEKQYSTYTHVSEGLDKLWHGDVVVFDDEKVVAYFGQIAVRSIHSCLNDRRKYLLYLAASKRTSPSPKGNSINRKRKETALTNSIRIFHLCSTGPCCSN